MHTWKERILKGLSWFVSLMLCIVVLVTLAQIMSRYFFHYPLIWTEELSLILMVWITYLGSIVLYAKHEHIGIDFLVERFPPVWQHYTRIISYILMLGFNVVLGVGGYLIIQTAKESISPGLKISVAWQYTGVFLGGVCMVILSLGHIWTEVKSKPRG